MIYKQSFSKLTMSSSKMNRGLLAVAVTMILLLGFASHISVNFAYAKGVTNYSKNNEDRQKQIDQYLKERQKAIEDRKKATSKQINEYQKGAERSKAVEEIQKVVENLNKEHQKITEKNKMEIEKAKQERMKAIDQKLRAELKIKEEGKKAGIIPKRRPEIQRYGPRSQILEKID